MKLRLALRLLVFAIPMALEIQKAQDRASKQDYSGAMSSLRHAYGLVGEEIPSRILNVEANILSALVASRLGILSLVCDCVATARVQLLKDFGERHRDDVEYMKSYCDDLIGFVAAQGYDLKDVPLKVGSHSAFDIAKVRSGLKVMFPMFD